MNIHQANSPDGWSNRAFTLIELLIVVAIIAILAAIAVPNFLEAQTRAKVARTKADLRTFATAMEIYNVDYNTYPPLLRVAISLTTPVAYLTSSQLIDPFGTLKDNPQPPDYVYGYMNLKDNIIQMGFLLPAFSPMQVALIGSHEWLIIGRGPDRDMEAHDERVGHQITPRSVVRHFNRMLDGTLAYDPSNGTVSDGDIVRSGKGFVVRAIEN